MDLKNDLLLRVANGEATARPPVWLMRQAGRILPQYRAIRSKLADFRELVRTPALAAEVTIQPVDELDVDAAIIFSDILVIPEAMGLDYEMIEKKGPFFPKTIRSARDIEALIYGEAAASRLDYVYEAIRITVQDLEGRVPLIGFAGAPWTIMAYMVEGSGSKTFSQAKRLLYKEEALAHTLLQMITS
ncbi:MAG: uroporphyrinogen decarboxylase family protein, partial [Bacteroidota bacterium]